MRRIMAVPSWSLAASALLLLAAAGCSDRNVDGGPGGGATDGGWPNTEGSPLPDTLPPLDFDHMDHPGKKDSSGPLPPGCPGCRDYVFSQIRLPATSSEAIKYAYPYKGKQYNAVGNTLALLSSQFPKMNFQDSITGSVHRGKALILMRLQADNLQNDPSVRAQFWIGADGKCCSSMHNPALCAQQAKAGCFNGKAALKIDPSSSADMIFSGSISGGQLRLGPARMRLRFSISGVSSDLPLTQALVRGQVGSSSISGGVLNAAVEHTDIVNILVPQIAKMLHQTYNSPGIDYKTRDMLRQLFDTNKDGKITVAEVLNNALVKTFLKSDFDPDGDGTSELSMGMGFAAVRCKIVN